MASRRGRASLTKAEFHGVRTGDERLDARLFRIVGAVAPAPARSFPDIAGTDAALEALYRFLENDRVDWRDIVKSHIVAAAARCCAARVVRVLHDTSFLSYAGEREGLGPIAGGKRGYGIHVSLAVTADEARDPLGIVALSPFVREDKPKKRTNAAKLAQTLENRQRPRGDKESNRWNTQAIEVDRLLGANVECIHIMDQEADDFALLAELVDAGVRFVVRGSAMRRLDRHTAEHVGDRLASAPATVFRTVGINVKGKATERAAHLEIRAASIVLQRPQYAQHDQRELELNVVQVFEPNPPSGQDPVEWTLYTREPIATVADMTTVVDHYRARWRIEEYFKALKTGCAIEKRQLESYDALLRALAIFVPIAWGLLRLRTLARSATDLPASTIFDEVQLAVMQAIAKNHKLPPNPTIRDAYLVIAGLGGHIKNNGDPGWIVLGRGYDDFVKAEMGWRAAMAAMKK